MRVCILDGRLLTSQPDFRRQYLSVAPPEGAEYFGRNIAAFRDAVTAGGPGWPGGPCILRVERSAIAVCHLGRRFIESLRAIVREAGDVSIDLA